MKEKLKTYIDDIFADAPVCEKTEEMKEEMYNNLCDRYDDLISEGKSQSAAYNSVIAGVGDVSEIIDAIRREEYPMDTFGEVEHKRFSPEETERVARYKKRKGVLSAISTAMFIICWLPLVIVPGIVGLVIMMIIIAAATGIKIYIGATAPESLKDEKSQSNNEGMQKENKKGKNHPFKKIFSAILWPITGICFICGIVFYGWIGFWWMLFIIAAAIQNIEEAIVDLVTGGGDYE